MFSLSICVKTPCLHNSWTWISAKSRLCEQWQDLYPVYKVAAPPLFYGYSSHFTPRWLNPEKTPPHMAFSHWVFLSFFSGTLQVKEFKWIFIFISWDLWYEGVSLPEDLAVIPKQSKWFYFHSIILLFIFFKCLRVIYMHIRYYDQIHFLFTPSSSSIPWPLSLPVSCTFLTHWVHLLLLICTHMYDYLLSYIYMYM